MSAHAEMLLTLLLCASEARSSPITPPETGAALTDAVQLLEAKFEAKFQAQEAKFQAQEAKFQAQEAKFQAQEERFKLQEATIAALTSSYSLLKEDRPDEASETNISLSDKWLGSTNHTQLFAAQATGLPGEGEDGSLLPSKYRSSPTGVWITTGHGLSLNRAFRSGIETMSKSAWLCARCMYSELREMYLNIPSDTSLRDYHLWGYEKLTGARGQESGMVPACKDYCQPLAWPCPSAKPLWNFYKNKCCPTYMNDIPGFKACFGIS